VSLSKQNQRRLSFTEHFVSKRLILHVLAKRYYYDDDHLSLFYNGFLVLRIVTSNHRSIQNRNIVSQSSCPSLRNQTLHRELSSRERYTLCRNDVMTVVRTSVNTFTKQLTKVNIYHHYILSILNLFPINV